MNPEFDEIGPTEDPTRVHYTLRNDLGMIALVGFATESEEFPEENCIEYWVEVGGAVMQETRGFAATEDAFKKGVVKAASAFFKKLTAEAIPLMMGDN